MQNKKLDIISTVIAQREDIINLSLIKLLWQHAPVVTMGTCLHTLILENTRQKYLFKAFYRLFICILSICYIVIKINYSSTFLWGKKGTKQYIQHEATQ